MSPNLISRFYGIVLRALSARLESHEPKPARRESPVLHSQGVGFVLLSRCRRQSRDRQNWGLGPTAPAGSRGGAPGLPYKPNGGTKARFCGGGGAECDSARMSASEQWSSTDAAASRARRMI